MAVLRRKKKKTPTETDILSVEEALSLIESGHVINYKFCYGGNDENFSKTTLQFKKEDGQYQRIDIDDFGLRRHRVVDQTHIQDQIQVWRFAKKNEIEFCNSTTGRTQEFFGKITFTSFHKSRVPARKKNSSVIDETVSKTHLYSHLLDSYSNDAVILPEISLGNRRADFVVFCDDGIHAYEIKSEVDNLSRIQKQIEQYKKFANTVTLVIHENKLKKIPDDKSLGILLVTKQGIKHKRKSKRLSPPVTNLYDLTWSIELKRLLIGFSGCSNKNRQFYLNYLSQYLSADVQRKYLFQLFISRYINENQERRQLASKDLVHATSKKRVFGAANCDGLPIIDFFNQHGLGLAPEPNPKTLSKAKKTQLLINNQRGA